jgi:uncharacterized protein YjbI with pentapeptide repeats
MQGRGGIWSAAAAVVLFAGYALLLGRGAAWLDGSTLHGLTASQRAGEVDTMRGYLIQIGAGVLAAGALLYTALNFQLAREGHVTDRYTKAIEQLGSDRLDVRLGAIYALERIMIDSPRDHPTIVEVLAAFVREHAPARKKAPAAGPSPNPDVGGQPGQYLPLATDVQAAATVLGRRPAGRTERGSVDLHATNLTGADLIDARLDGANLTDANLTSADLSRASMAIARLNGANLTGATLTSANLADAWLNAANLTDATVAGTNLTGAWLVNANLTSAHMTNANLTEANLTGASLDHASLAIAHLADAYLGGANLGGADLADADLRNADLTGVDLFEANLTEAGLAAANLTGANLARANLARAHLRDADLTGANLTDANLDGADLDGADLEGVLLTDEQRSVMRYALPLPISSGGKDTNSASGPAGEAGRETAG